MSKIITQTQISDAIGRGGGGARSGRLYHRAISPNRNYHHTIIRRLYSVCRQGENSPRPEQCSAGSRSSERRRGKQGSPWSGLYPVVVAANNVPPDEANCKRPSNDHHANQSKIRNGNWRNYCQCTGTSRKETKVGTPAPDYPSQGEIFMAKFYHDIIDNDRVPGLDNLPGCTLSTGLSTWSYYEYWYWLFCPVF